MSLYRWVGLGLVIGAGVETGCANKPDRPGAVANEPVQAPDAERLVVVATDADPTRGEQAADLMGGSRGSTAFVQLERQGTASMALEREATSEGWVERRLVDGKPNSEATLVRGEGGAVLVVDEVVHEEGVRVEYDPPMVVIPGRLIPGQEHRQATRMTVFSIEGGRKPKSSGNLESVVTVVGHEQVRTPAGAMETIHVRQRFVAELSPARVVNTSDRWFARGMGLVAELRKERTTIGGLQIRASGEGWVLGASPDR